VEKIKELDGLRATAVLLVVVWHYVGVGENPILWRALIFGRIGVDLFFVLSGYLITRILLNSRERPGYFAHFYRRRAFRILPIYAVMVLLYLIGRNLRGSTAGYLFGGSVPWWSYIVGLQNWWMAAQQTYGARWLGGTWSLAVEEQFYLIFPLIVWYLRPARLPYILATMMILCPIARIITGVMGDHFGYYVLAPLRADILAVGALIAWAELAKKTAVAAPAIRKVLWVSLALFPVFAFLIGRNTDIHMALWGHTYLVALFGSIVFTVLQLKGSRRLEFLRTRPAHFFAKISYALYLVHGNVLFLTFLAAGSASTVSTWKGASLTAMAFALSVALCAASFRFFEAPLIERGHRPVASGLLPAVNPDHAAAYCSPRHVRNSAVGSVREPAAFRYLD
jgi:peptidoglycan/LPS O-acetylase OafA/YrhL